MGDDLFGKVWQEALRHLRSEIKYTPEQWRELEINLGIELVDLHLTTKMVEHSDQLIEHGMDILTVAEHALGLANGHADRAAWAMGVAYGDLIKEIAQDFEECEIPNNMREWVIDANGGVGSAAHPLYLRMAADALITMKGIATAKSPMEVEELRRELGWQLRWGFNLGGDVH